MVNLCRDEITHAFKHKIDQVFGSSFTVNGLGALLSCGLVGMGAGLSHSPVCEVRLQAFRFSPPLELHLCLAIARHMGCLKACGAI
jgi:hypothetical protein